MVCARQEDERRPFAGNEAVLGLQGVQSPLGGEILEHVRIEVAVDPTHDDGLFTLCEKLEPEAEGLDPSASTAKDRSGPAEVEGYLGRLGQCREQMVVQVRVESRPVRRG